MAELKLGTTIGGSVAWHEGNDGSGSGLDADYLDGNHASAFALSGHTHSYLSAESDTLATVTGRGDTTATLLKLTAATGGSTTTGTYALRVTGLSGYESLELGVQDNYQAVLRSYGNDIHYYAGHWRSTATASENHSHYWYTAKNGSTDWNSYKMRLDHNGALTVSSSGVFNGITINQERANNARIYSATTGAMGLLGTNSDGTFRFQVYGDGSNYGFLDATWGNWDINKTINGNMTLRVSGSNYTVYHTGNVPGWITGNQTITLSGDVSGSGTTSIAVTVNQIDGWGFANTGSNTAVNANTLDQNGITYYQSGVDNFSGNSTDGALYSQYYGSSWQHQIAGDYREGNIAVRGKNNGTWSRWKPIPTITISDSAPANETRGDLWWESDTGKLKIWYADANTEQWVDAMPIPDTSTFFSKAGGGITGPVNINSSLTITGNTYSKKTNLVANGAGWDDQLNLYSSDATNRWNVLVDSGASNRFRVAYNNSEKFYINTDGSAVHSGSLSASNLSGTNTGDQTNISGYAAYVTGNNTSLVGKLAFYGNGGNSGQGWDAYGLYQESGSWSNPFPDLAIHYHTGIKISSYYGYNGTRFYNNSGASNDVLLASVGDGDYNFRSYYNIIAYASDKRLKENVINIDNALHKVMQLNGVTFDWKKEVEDLGFSPTSWHECGVLAQEVEAVLPEAVEIAPFDYDWKAEDGSHSKSGQKYLTVKYEKIVPLLIEAMKEQQSQIQAQQDQINQLMNLVKEMKNGI